MSELLRGGSFTPMVGPNVVEPHRSGLTPIIVRLPFALEWADERAVDLGLRFTLSEEL